MEKFNLSFEEATAIVSGVAPSAAPLFKVTRNVGDQSIGGGTLAIGTKFVVVSQFDRAIDDTEKKESTVVPMLHVVTSEGTYNAISAGAFSGSTTTKDGQRVSPDTLNTAKRKLAYKALVGCKLSDVCEKLHAKYTKEQVYEVVGFQRVEAEDARSGFAKNVYCIALCD